MCIRDRAEADPEWTVGERGQYCRAEVGQVSGVIKTRWGTVRQTDWSTADIDVQIETDGVVLGEVTEWKAEAGRVGDAYDQLSLELKTADGKWAYFAVRLPEPRFYETMTQGVPRKMESNPFFGSGYQWDIPSQSYDHRFYLENGTINPILYSKGNGDEIYVEFTGKMYSPIED